VHTTDSLCCSYATENVYVYNDKIFFSKSDLFSHASKNFYRPNFILPPTRLINAIFFFAYPLGKNFRNSRLVRINEVWLYSDQIVPLFRPISKQRFFCENYVILSNFPFFIFWRQLFNLVVWFFICIFEIQKRIIENFEITRPN